MGWRASAFVTFIAAGLVAAAVARPCAQTQCGPQLGYASSTSAVINNLSPNQLGRLVRNGASFSSICADTGPGAAIINPLMSYHFLEVSSFEGVAPGCARVTIDMGSCALYAAAYSLFTPSAPQSNVLGQLGGTPNAGAQASFSFVQPGSFQVIVSDTTSAGCPSFDVTTVLLNSCRHPGFDAANDGRADHAIFRPATGTWYSLSHDGSFGATSFGTSTDVVVPGAYGGLGGVLYSGNGRSYPGVYRPSTGIWYALADGTLSAVPWGLASDIPMPNTDFNADGRADRSVFRPADGTWYSRSIGPSGTVIVGTQQFGANGDLPLVGDFDGDLITDHAVARPNGGVFDWYIRKSNFGGVVVGRQFGLATDKPVPADYDGDGRTDIAVWRPSDGTWYFLRSRDGSFGAFQFGTLGDTPQPADLNGDRLADFVVFRQSPTPGQTLWYAWLSGSNTLGVVQWGQQGDLPVTAANR